MPVANDTNLDSGDSQRPVARQPEMRRLPDADRARLAIRKSRAAKGVARGITAIVAPPSGRRALTCFRKRRAYPGALLASNRVGDSVHSILKSGEEVDILHFAAYLFGNFARIQSRRNEKNVLQRPRKGAIERLAQFLLKPATLSYAQPGEAGNEVIRLRHRLTECPPPTLPGKEPFSIHPRRESLDFQCMEQPFDDREIFRGIREKHTGMSLGGELIKSRQILVEPSQSGDLNRLSLFQAEADDLGNALQIGESRMQHATPGAFPPPGGRQLIDRAACGQSETGASGQARSARAPATQPLGLREPVAGCAARVRPDGQPPRPRSRVPARQAWRRVRWLSFRRQASAAPVTTHCAGIFAWPLNFSGTER